MRTGARWLISVGLVVLAFSACGSGGGEDDDGVASIDDSSVDEGDEGGDEGGGQGGRGAASPEFEDALLEYAQCMRGEGIDFPDPRTNGDGLVIMGGGARDGDGPPSEAEMDEMDAANETCQPILDAVEREMPRPDPEQEAEMRDEALAFSECMRDHGVEDFPDPQFDEDGGMQMRVGGPDGGGIDPSDPDFQEAQEACGEEGGPGVRVGAGSSGDGPSEATNEDEG